MGNGESQISHETVNRTDPNASNQGRQVAQEENEKRVRQLESQLRSEREQELREAQERARCEDENQREILDRQKRQREERERKIKEKKEFHELQNALMTYDFQERPRIKKESFRDLDVSDIDVVRIALIGPTGSGKTSFVGTMQQALNETQGAFEQGTGKEGTIHLEEYFVQNHVRLVDTRGFFESDENLFHECLNIMTGRVRPGEEISRNYDQGKTEEVPNSQPTRRAQELAKFAHAVIFVVKANDPRLTDGKYKEMLEKIREHFREDGYSPVTVITHLDRIKGEGNKENAFDMASGAIGSSSERTYFISNYIDEQHEKSMAVERTALDVLDFALMSAERFIRIRKQREKNQMARDTAAGGANIGAETLEQFFARLKKKYHWTDQGRMKEITSHLRKEDINTVKALKELWADLKSELPLSVGMRRCMEEEISKI